MYATVRRSFHSKASASRFACASSAEAGAPSSAAGAAAASSSAFDAFLTDLLWALTALARRIVAWRCGAEREAVTAQAERRKRRRSVPARGSG